MIDPHRDPQVPPPPKTSRLIMTILGGDDERRAADRGVSRHMVAGDSAASPWKHLPVESCPLTGPAPAPRVAGSRARRPQAASCRSVVVSAARAVEIAVVVRRSSRAVVPRAR